MNEIVLELILMAVMAFFMVFGLAGCQREKKQAKEMSAKPEEAEEDMS